MKGLYDEYPRRYGKTKRVIYTKDEFLYLINRDNGYSDVFTSVFHYANLKEKNGEVKIDPDSAVIDKIFIDCDFKDWKRKEDLFKKIINLNEILEKKEILRIIVFSGGGFHVYIYIENRPINKKTFCRNSLIYISNLVCKDEYIEDNNGNKIKLQLWDKKCQLKLSQMARVIGTYNPKRKLFCTSLNNDDLKKGLDHIIKKSKKQNKKIHYLGKKLLRLNEKFDEDLITEKCSATLSLNIENYPKNLKDLLLSLSIIWEEIPLCIKNLMLIEDLDYVQRYIFITFLYRNGLDSDEIKEVLKLTLSPLKLYHCCGIKKDGFRPTSLQRIGIENQVENIIENDYYISCKYIRESGLCIKTCDLDNVLHYIS